MLRRRLVLSVAAVAIVAVSATGWLVLRALEDQLIADVDAALRTGPMAGAAEVLPGLLTEGPDEQPPSRGPRRPIRVRDQFDTGAEVAAVVYRDGRPVLEFPSGRDDDPDPLFDATAVRRGGGYQTIEAVDGSLRYRVGYVRVADGRGIAIGQSLETVDGTLDDARRILVTTGLLATITIAGLSWLLIRRTFQPVETMIASADRIAAGDLDARTGVHDPTNEVGRLGMALDTMLDRIQEAVDAQTASQERLRQFVAEASHELRTPLTSVRGYAELYRQGGTDPDTVALSMARIESEATRMTRLVEDLLTLARLDREPDRAAASVDVAVAAGEAVDAARVVDDARSYDLAVDPGAWIVEGDRDRLRQVMDNLLNNARLYTPPATSVGVHVGPGPRGVRITVTDDGPGIPEADRPRVFQRFWRATRTDENPVDGSGLGLSIVESIVAHHGGSVAVGTAPDGGARFDIDLPGAPAPAS